MRQRLVDVVAYVRPLLDAFERARTPLAAGGLAYFVALALAPTAVAFGSLAGLVLDPSDIASALDSIAGDTPVAADHAQSAVNVLVSLVESSSASSFTITTVVSIVIAVYASSKVVLGLRQALDTTFGVRPTVSGLVQRGIAAVVTLAGLIIGVALVILVTALPRLLDWLRVDSVAFTTGSWVLDWAVLVVLVYLGVRGILRHGPAGHLPVPWRSLGVAFATLWIVAVTGGLGLYVRFSSSLSAAILIFGTAVVILLWLYLCFLGLLWGAVIEADSQARTRRPTGSGGEPARRPGDDGDHEGREGPADPRGDGAGEREHQADEPRGGSQPDGRDAREGQSAP